MSGVIIAVERVVLCSVTSHEINYLLTESSFAGDDRVTEKARIDNKQCNAFHYDVHCHRVCCPTLSLIVKEDHKVIMG